MEYRIRAATLADAAGLARVHVTTWQSAYRAIVPDAYLDSLSVAKQTDRWSGWLGTPAPGMGHFLAEGANGEIIGFVTAGPRREGPAEFAGEILAIYVLAEHQGQGMGRVLVRRAMQYLREQGMTSMLVWVLSENHPSRRFYETLGGMPISTKVDEVGGKALEETAYGWADITTIK